LPESVSAGAASNQLASYDVGNYAEADRSRRSNCILTVEEKSLRPRRRPEGVSSRLTQGSYLGGTGSPWKARQLVFFGVKCILRREYSRLGEWRILGLMKIGVFGGTFNPPHIGHIDSARHAADQLCLDKLIVVPAGIPPHKSIPAGSPAPSERLCMTREAFSGINNAEVSEIEIYGSGPNYTADTITALSRDYPGSSFFLIVGTDMFLSLETWKDSAALLKNVTPAALTRSGGETQRIAEYSRALKERHGTETAIVANDIIDISSSQLRKMLPEREGIRYIIDATYSYIIQNRLYGAKPDWAWLRKKAYAMLSDSRIPHVAGCEREALSLAEKWGVGRDDAQEAAILHDITKNLSESDHLDILEKHAFSGERPGRGEGKLFHSLTGALVASDMFGVSHCVAEAIRWHTTGKPGMSALEKIIYLADYIEPTRNAEGIEGLGELRELAYSDLDAAMILGLRMSIQDMLERGITPNRMTYDALD